MEKDKTLAGISRAPNVWIYVWSGALDRNWNKVVEVDNSCPYTCLDFVNWGNSWLQVQDALKVLLTFCDKSEATSKF